MYTYCTIQWIDDQSEMDIIIKASDELDDKDEYVFFYGVSPNILKWAMENGAILENEWKVISIIGVSNDINEFI